MPVISATQEVEIGLLFKAILGEKLAKMLS
jgi:hypothetical protein